MNSYTEQFKNNYTNYKMKNKKKIKINSYITFKIYEIRKEKKNQNMKSKFKNYYINSRVKV